MLIYTVTFGQKSSKLIVDRSTARDFTVFGISQPIMPYPCSHFYFDIKFGNRLYSKERLISKLQPEVVNIWIFIFLAKQNISTNWEPKNSAEKPVQLASSFSLFFSVSPQVFLDFSQQLLSSFKNRAKIQLFLTQMERVLIRWHVSSALCTLLKVAFFQKVLIHLSFPQKHESFIFLNLRFWIFVISKAALRGCSQTTLTKFWLLLTTYPSALTHFINI